LEIWGLPDFQFRTSNLEFPIDVSVLCVSVVLLNASIMQLAEINALEQDAFVEAIGWVFENSPWVAARVWAARPFSCVEALHTAMISEVEAASEEEQLALLRSHPDLGTRARIGSASAAEQARVGLDSLTAEEFDRITRLNAAYRSKFGFPFLFAVKGSTKLDILCSLEQRLNESPEAEHREALRQVYRIAEFRLLDSIT